MATKGTGDYYVGRTWHLSFRIEKDGGAYTPENWDDNIYCFHFGRSDRESAPPELTVKLTKGTETVDGVEFKTLSGRAEKTETVDVTGGRHYRDLAAADVTKDPDWFVVKNRSYITVYEAPDTEPCDD